MIEPKTAVENAVKYYREVSADSSQLVLEGLELSTDKKKWHVTLSHTNPTDSLAVLLGTQSQNRLYKLFIVDAESGAVESMKATKI